MDPFLTQLKDNILIYADEPSDSVKYTDGWIYQQIGRESANLFQQAISQHHLLGLSTQTYTVAEGQYTFPLPGNFQKLVVLQGLDTSSRVSMEYHTALDYGEEGMILLGPYEFTLSVTPAAGSVLKLVYQKKALPDLFYASALSTSTDSKVDVTVQTATGLIRQSTNYYVGSYLHIVSSSEAGLEDQIRRISASSLSSGTLSLTLESVLPASLTVDSVVEIMPEIPQEHWDAIAWAVVRKMRNSARDEDAVTQAILEYKEARHWYLQAMATLGGRSGNQVVPAYPSTSEDEVW